MTQLLTVNIHERKLKPCKHKSLYLLVHGSSIHRSLKKRQFTGPSTEEWIEYTVCSHCINGTIWLRDRKKLCSDIFCYIIFFEAAFAKRTWAHLVSKRKGMSSLPCFVYLLINCTNFLTTHKCPLSHYLKSVATLILRPGKPYKLEAATYHGEVTPWNQSNYLIGILAMTAVTGLAGQDMKHLP